jgi:hypothetical protein
VTQNPRSQTRHTRSSPVVALGAVTAAFVGVMLAEPALSVANPYESFISIENEDDLYDLQAAQVITEETFSQLLDLLTRGVDINTADRDGLYELPNLTYDEVDAILALRDLQGRIPNPADLVATGVISADKLYAISAFLIASPDRENPLAAHGYVRALMRTAVNDRKLPATLLQSRVKALTHWTAGLAGVLTRERIGEPVWDSTRNALVADPQKLRAELPKAFLRYEDDQFSAIAGSYRIGFGQRLVFDNTNAYNPNGLTYDDQIFFDSDLTKSCKESKGELAVSPCDGKESKYVTPDFKWRDGLFGSAGGAKHIVAGDGWLQLYAWGSYSRRSIYQYELVNRDKCADPNDDKDPNCAAPQVYRRPNGPILTPTSRFSFQTLPNVFGELLGGANASYFINRRSHVGITGYGASEQVLIGGVKLDTQEWSRLPTGRRFGAVGANFAFGHDWLDVFGEVAYSFDKSPNPPGAIGGGGGPGAIVRATFTQKVQELEASVRYYGTNFANPYARPLAASDEVNGQRARDELGTRIRHQYNDKRFTLRSYMDLWLTLSDKIPKADTYFRADIKANKEWRWGGWLRYRDKDLREAGSNQCYEVPTDNDENGEPIPCKGQQLTSIARVGFTPDKSLSTTLQVQLDLVDDKDKHPTSFRKDVSAWLIALYKPTNLLRLRGRVRYLFEDVVDNKYLEQSVSGYVDGLYRFRQRDDLRLRLETKYFLDKRAATIERSPSPEISVWLGYEAHF